MEQNLNLYYVFYEAARCRSFSAAAARLYISQPAVSKAISKLEDTLQVTLFYRSSRSVTLTASGELLFKYVDAALLSLKSGEETLRAVTNNGVSHLSIGVSTTLCKYMLLPFLKDFMDRSPNIKITISCQSTFDTLSSLKSGSIDIGLVGIPASPVYDKNTFSFLPLKTIEDIFVASGSYLSACKNKSEGLTNQSLFCEASFIMLNKENISRKHADAFLLKEGISLENVIEVNNMDLSIEFAKAGLGIACVIREFVAEDLKKGTLHELKLGHRIPKRQIGFAYSNKLPLSGALNTFIQYYKQV